jgi:hypothetical protein
MAKRRIFIDKKTGNTIALVDNVIDNIACLGTKTIKRAADVEFNNSTQQWEIIAPDGTVLGQHPRRDEAIKMEIQLVEAGIRQKLCQNQSSNVPQ